MFSPKYFTHIFCYCRISEGTCISNLALRECTELSSESYKVTLTRGDSVSANKMAAGDMVVVSEAGSRAVIITTTRVLDVSGDLVTLLLDRYARPTPASGNMNEYINSRWFRILRILEK